MYIWKSFFKQNFTIMKKILLTLVVGFCFGGVAVAQDPAKVAKKKAKANLSTLSSADAAKLKAKEAKVKAMESGKAAPSTPAQSAKAALTVDKAN